MTNIMGMDGILFFLLFIVFLVLKLTGFIYWSWWGITAPFWLPALIYILFTGILFITVILVKGTQ